MFTISALARNLGICVAIAIIIYLIYLRKVLIGRSSGKRENMDIIMDNFERCYARCKSAIKSTEAVSGLFGINKIYVSNAINAAKLGALKIENIGPNATDEEVAKFIGTASIGMSSGRNISPEISVMHQGIKRIRAQESMIIEKTEGMHVISQLGISFFFPMFAGISSNIMQASIGAASIGSIPNAFALSVMLYIGVILFITASFKSPKDSVGFRVNSVVPLFVTGVLVFLIASSFSSVF